MMLDSQVETAASAQGAASGPTAEELRFAATFTRIVSVLMRSSPYKHYTLADLEWLVVPPLMAGQYAVLDATVNGAQVPVAVALWARVSEELDRRLTENVALPLRLRPDEWRSGEILWLVDAVGDGNAIPHLLARLRETAFKGREVKIRRHGNGLRSPVTTLAPASTN